MKFLFVFVASFCWSYDYINSPTAWMHKTNDAMSPLVSEAIYGTEVQIIQAQGAWSEIVTPEGYRGWVENKNLIVRDAPYPSTDIRAKVNRTRSFVSYDEETVFHPTHMELPYGVILEILSSRENLEKRWIKIRLLDSKEYWIQKGDILLTQDQMTLDNMLLLSKGFIGIPYRYGGVSSFGCDCSGFVQTLFLQRGIRLPRDSYQQYDADIFVSVDLEQLQKGDLLFFGRNRVSHVGIYMGNDQMIHSMVECAGVTPFSGVQTTSFSAFKKAYPFKGARRLK
ncbi:MAG: C40 family peptidase [Parachlamydiales bacterium]|nr:C40 family peptidase [Parachlamydiales bacterium]